MVHCIKRFIYESFIQTDSLICPLDSLGSGTIRVKRETEREPEKEIEWEGERERR